LLPLINTIIYPNFIKINRIVWNKTLTYKIVEFVETFTRQHRTLQQSMFGAMLAVVSKVGSDDYRTDARNEQSKSTAKKLLDGYEEESYKELIAQGDSEVSARKYAKLFRERLNSLSFI